MRSLRGAGNFLAEKWIDKVLDIKWMRERIIVINPLGANPLQNGQTHSNNSSAVANELFECV